jgi:hypothetical protein
MDRVSAAREIIGDCVAQRCSQVFGNSLRAVIVTGSVARDEATLFPEENGWRILGDADFLLIFRDATTLPDAIAMRKLREDVETSILQERIIVHIDISAGHATYLQRLCPDIGAYELRNCGKVIWGDSKILANILPCSPAAIPLEDAWRLLSNRMVEHLNTFDELQKKPTDLSPQAFYRTLKLYLDMATSFLVFAGDYAPTYAQRAERLAALPAKLRREIDLPFDLQRFSERVTECAKWKISNNDPCRSQRFWSMASAGFGWWTEAIDWAGKLWRWELERLTRSSGQENTNQLLRRWMQGQPLSRRGRGWLYVARDQGWVRAWKNWPRWARLAWRASPRYWVYGVANEMFAIQASCIDQNAELPERGPKRQALRSYLPVVPALMDSHELSEWSKLTKEIIWNYEKFLQPTKA